MGSLLVGPSHVQQTDRILEKVADHAPSGIPRGLLRSSAPTRSKGSDECTRPWLWYNPGPRIPSPADPSAVSDYPFGLGKRRQCCRGVRDFSDARTSSIPARPNLPTHDSSHYRERMRAKGEPASVFSARSLRPACLGAHSLLRPQDGNKDDGKARCADECLCRGRIQKAPSR